MKPLTRTQILRRRCRRIHADQRRRAQAEGAALNYDADDLVFMAERNRLCAYCRCPLDFSCLRFDHRKPIARGGKHAIANLVACCDRCNRLKGRLEADEFAQLLGFLKFLHPAARADLERRLLCGANVYTGARKARKG